MTDIEEKDISPKDQHSKEVSERSSKTFDGTKHKEEPPSKRQRAESGAVVSTPLQHRSSSMHANRNQTINHHLQVLPNIK
jgi:hypothetical protein